MQNTRQSSNLLNIKQHNDNSVCQKFCHANVKQAFELRKFPSPCKDMQKECVVIRPGQKV